jgi:hypothetical protein
MDDTRDRDEGASSDPKKAAKDDDKAKDLGFDSEYQKRDASGKRPTHRGAGGRRKYK